MKPLVSALVTCACLVFLSPGVRAETAAAEKEFVFSLVKLVDQKFGGDWDRAYAHFGSLSGSPQLEPDDVASFICIANPSLGSGSVLQAKVAVVVDGLDRNDNGRVSRSEFVPVFEDLVAGVDWKTVRRHIYQLVVRYFDGSAASAFELYAALVAEDDRVDEEELMLVLQDAGIGNWMTRRAWASLIIEGLDTNGDAALDRDEFAKLLRRAN